MNQSVTPDLKIAISLMEELRERFIRFIIGIASGNPTNNEKNDYREIAIFKSGVTL